MWRLWFSCDLTVWIRLSLSFIPEICTEHKENAEEEKPDNTPGINLSHAEKKILELKTESVSGAINASQASQSGVSVSGNRCY